MEPFHFTGGRSPLIVSCPHDGLAIPPELAERMTPEALSLPDTDWHVARLYDFTLELGASVLLARYSRYVVDLNRDPSGKSLYPGADTTEICPISTFSRAPVYRPGAEPSQAEIAERLEQYFVPYHQRLEQAIGETLKAHGVAVLFDAHSIRSRVPRFFEGQLPDLNLGTSAGTSCAESLRSRAFEVLSAAQGYTAVCDGRFKGGYITRHYAAPDKGVHTLQLELAQKNYMDERPPYVFDVRLANELRKTLRALLEACTAWAEEHK